MPIMLHFLKDGKQSVLKKLVVQPHCEYYLDANVYENHFGG
jgi:hypothetical protein